jgi:hypothetical protein
MHAGMVMAQGGSHVEGEVEEVRHIRMHDLAGPAMLSAYLKFKI